MPVSLVLKTKLLTPDFIPLSHFMLTAILYSRMLCCQDKLEFGLGLFLSQAVYSGVFGFGHTE